jgi:hypothetical protein
MAQLKVAIDDFNLNASWSCYFRWNSSADWYSVWQSNAEATKQVTFRYTLPENSIITGAKVHSVWGLSLFGIQQKTINGIEPDADGFVAIDVSGATDTALTVDFLFVASKDNLQDTHDSEIESIANGGDYDKTYTLDTHTSSAKVSDVYLVLEYESAYTPPELIDYTDPNPVAGETYVKAVHMTELHTNVNLLRVAKNLGEYSFTDIVQKESLLSGWNAHTAEIRAALDEVSTEHEEWLALGDNCPRLDVLLQLRRVVSALC